MAEYIEREFNPCDVCDCKQCSNCVLHELAMKVVGHPTTDVVPVVHGQWIEEHGQTLIPVEYDDSGNLVLHDYTTYRCNLCGRTESKKEPYCNCGARMDGDDND